jgi:UDP-glucose 4-epimerase
MIREEATLAYRGRSVLVTGGCGFIGSHLVETLDAAGAEVAVLDSFQAGKRLNLASVAGHVRIVRGDVREPAQVERILSDSVPSIVFHLAANASVPGSVEEPAFDFETNCAGTFVLLEALRKRGWPKGDDCRVVFASSGAVYGEPERFPIREEHPLRAISPYGASKLAAEIEALMFHQVYGLPVVIARLFNTYGARMARFVVLDFLRKLDRDPNVLEILGSGEQRRDFNDVSDTVAALLVLGRRGEPGQAYNVASGRSCSVTDLAHLIIATLGLEGRTRIVTTGQSWVGDAQRWEVAIDKIAAMGYRPRVSLAEGVRRVIQWHEQGQRPLAEAHR